MRNLFLDPSSIVGKSKVIINGEYYPYLKNVLRVKKGSRLTAIISAKIYELCVEKIEKNKIVCSIVSIDKKCDTFQIRLNVYQSLLKFKKMDLVVSKLGEIGIEAFTPVICDRTVPRDVPGKTRLERWKRLASEGGKSSGILRLMKIEPPAQFLKIIENMDGKEKESAILFTPGSNYPHILDILNVNFLKIFESVNIFFGPEGGFTEREIEMFSRIGGNVVNMGSITFRSDTAAIIGTGIIKIILEKISQK
ncbi:MAG: hypothetical protein DRP54_01340 [Spirochaetes bacterium]|nr:MAG: hypothetical protein DRP54_01340 [Spirochaetota bacterium]